MKEMEILRSLIGTETKVSIVFEEVGITLSDNLYVGSDSRLKPIHRLNVHDRKGNTLLIQLDNDRLSVQSSASRAMSDEGP